MTGPGSYEDDEPFELEDEADDEAGDELSADAENGECCVDCGEYFIHPNRKPSLCLECYDSSLDQGVTPHAPKSEYPIRG